MIKDFTPAKTRKISGANAMKRAASVFAALCAATAAASAGADLLPLTWSRGICVPSRFSANSSGEMRVCADGENAVRFDVKFAQGADFWAYPIFRFQSHENFADAEAVRFEIKANAPNGFKHANLMVNGRPPYKEIPFPTGEYKTVTIDVGSLGINPAKVSEIRIGVNPVDSEISYSIRNLEFLSSKKIEAVFEASDAVAAGAPGSVFIQGEPLKFTLKPYAAAETQWILRNWKGEKIRSGEWPCCGKSPLILDAIPNGYYKLELESAEAKFTGFRSFAVVPDPAGRPANRNTFFAMDSAQSWLAGPDGNNPRRPENAYEIVSEVARRSGMRMVRERLSWAGTEMEEGKFDWRQYKTNADLLSSRGIKILGVYHDAPPWAKNTSHLPCDLAATYRYAKKAAETFKGQMAAWEFWNEQDIGFTSESAWDYASALKAAYLGFKAADPKIPVAVGGYAIVPILNYNDVVLKSGTGEYFDIFSVHTYLAIKDYPEIVKNVREHMERNGIADKPVWFTENGSRMEGSGRMDSHIPGIRMHSPDQEMIIAEFIPKMMVNMQMLGVDRDFFFVLPPYSEGGGSKDWGLMRRDFTVKPGYVAFATLIDKLGNAKLEGEADLGEGVRGFLYKQKDGSKTLIYWSISEIDDGPIRPDLSPADRLERPFRIPAGGTYRGVDIFGMPFKTDGSEAVATRYPAILENVKGVGLSVPFKKYAAKKSKAQSIDKTVVFRTELSEDFTLSAGKDCVSVGRDGAKFKLQIWNLSDEDKSGSVSISGGKVTGLPGEITVAPFEKAELELAITPELDKSFKGEMRIEGVFNGKKTSPHVVVLQDLGKMKDSGLCVEMRQMLDPANWRKNASGQMDISYDGSEQAIRFGTKFPPSVDRWVYPEYTLQLPQESLKGAIGLEFEMKVSDKNAVSQMLVMPVSKDSDRIHIAPPEAIGSEWQKNFFQFPDGVPPENFVALRIGLNSKSDDITYWVRNIKIYYAR